jgi:hypothetical protein
LVSDIKGETQTEGVEGLSAEENISPKEKLSDKRVKKTA